MSFFKSIVVCAVLAAGAWSAGQAHAQGFGTDTYAVSGNNSIDSNGQHHPQDTCSTALGVCNTSTSHGRASAITTLGFVSGSVAGDSTGNTGWGSERTDAPLPGTIQRQFEMPPAQTLRVWPLRGCEKRERLARRWN